MAMLTSTAIALGALAVSAGSTAVSFTQAAKQGKMQKEAEADAKKYMADARKKLDVNFYEQLGIQKEPYELEREALLSVGAQAIEAGVESERGAASTAGRVQMAQQEGQRKIAGAMGQELLGLEKLAAAEESRLRDTDVNLDLASVQGAQLAARDAEQAKALAVKQGMQGVTSMATQAADLFPEYKQTVQGQKDTLGKMNFTAEEFQKFGDVAESGGLGKPQIGFGEGFTNLDFEKVSKMTDEQYSAFLKALTKEQKKSLFGNQQYKDLYNNPLNL